ncbi:MAG: hypothetical protein IKP35_03520 [Alphaproteobacteria bacterium]|nr:hypothetical protein [Alphaproteobacteria bacterium]
MRKNILSESEFYIAFKRALYNLTDYDVKPNMVISPKTYLHEDLNLDSLDIVGITYELEQKYNVAILDENYSKLQTVNDFYKWFSHKVASNGTPRTR